MRIAEWGLMQSAVSEDSQLLCEHVSRALKSEI